MLSELVDCWGSDYRTHTTESKRLEFVDKIKRLDLKLEDSLSKNNTIKSNSKGDLIIKNPNDKEILSEKGNILSKLICLIYLLDFSTIYRSVLSGIDPTPISSINFVKKRI